MAPKNHILLFAAAFALLFTSALSAVAVTPAIETFVDQKEWEVVRSAPGHFGTGCPDGNAVLLRSRQAKGRGGADQPLREVNLIILCQNKIAFDFLSPLIFGRSGSGVSYKYYLEDRTKSGEELELKDFTGDGVPEVVFQSGFAYASGLKAYVHILSYVPGRGFWDISEGQFYRTEQDYLRWLDNEGISYALAARAVRPSELHRSDTHSCPTCPKFFQYLLYRWDQERKAFVITCALLSREAFPGRVNPIADQLEFSDLKERLKTCLACDD